MHIVEFWEGTRDRPAAVVVVERQELVVKRKLERSGRSIGPAQTDLLRRAKCVREEGSMGRRAPKGKEGVER